jgi:hypothetical protein
MTKARDLANLIAAGNPLADGAISVAEISDLTASAADLNATNVTTLGTVEASKVVTADANGDVKFPDNEKALFGTGSDLQIYHDGTSSLISDQGNGPLLLRATDFQMTNSAGSQYIMQGVDGGAVTLYHAGSGKVATTATGIDVTGNATFADNGKAIFGAGSDLQIYHNGSVSVISEQGTGDLNIQTNGNGISLLGNGGSEFMAAFVSNGSASLFYDSAKKIETTSVGADVTGELIADSYNETYAALSGTSPAVNCHNGNSFSLVLSGNTTFTFTNPPASGTAYTFSIEIIQNSGGSGYSVTWPSSVDWPAATAPTLTADANAKDIFVFTTRDGGTNWYGFTAGQALG